MGHPATLCLHLIISYFVAKRKLMLSFRIKRILVVCLFCMSIITVGSSHASAQTHVPVIAVIHIDAVPQYAATIGGLLKDYAQHTAKEQGVKRCKIFQEVGRSNHYTIVEEWTDQAAYDTHVGDAHSRQFREKIQPMLGAPVDERLHTELE